MSDPVKHGGHRASVPSASAAQACSGSQKVRGKAASGVGVAELPEGNDATPSSEGRFLLFNKECTNLDKGTVGLNQIKFPAKLLPGVSHLS